MKKTPDRYLLIIHKNNGILDMEVYSEKGDWI